MSDPDHATGRVYGAEKSPDEQFPAFAKRLTFLIGPDGTVRKTYTVTDPGAHPEEVLEDIRRLAADV